MKSVSIVYKRSRTTRDLSNGREKPLEIRRAVDEYYTKLVEKGKNQDEIMQKIRSHTARATRMSDRKKIFSSLSIAAIAPPSPQLQLKFESQKKISKTPLLNIKRATQQTFFTLNLPDGNFDSERPACEKRDLKYGSLSRHAQLKILHPPKFCKQATLVLSIDLVYNELNFWGEEWIDQSAVRIWKTLSGLTNLVWVVRRETTYRKVVSFAQSFNLRLDGVVQVEPSKKQSLTVSYHNLEKYMKVPRTHKLLIINTLRNESLLSLRPEQFRNTLPLVTHPSTFVHFAQINMNDKNRFAAVRKIVSRPLPEPFPMRSILREHDEKKGRFRNEDKRGTGQETTLETDEPVGAVNALEYIEMLKQSLLRQLGQSIGLTTRLENGDSVNYLIGDMLRRNYQIIKAYLKSCHEPELRRESGRLRHSQNRLAVCSSIQYNRNVYIWDFDPNL